MTDLAVKIHGIPAPKGSLQCIGAVGNRKHQLVESSDAALKLWRPQVVKAGLHLRRKAGGQILGPVIVIVTLTVPRPKTVTRPWPHLKAGPNAPGGDVDKLARTILDGLCDKPAALFGNDAQVCGLEAWKCYPDTPGCPDRLDEPGAIIRVTRLGGDRGQ